MNKNVVARIIVNTKMLCLIINVSDIRWMEIEIKNHKQGACKIKEIIINSNKQGLIVHIHCLEYILSLKHDKWILFYFEGSSFMIFSFNSIHRMFETILFNKAFLYSLLFLQQHLCSHSLFFEPTDIMYQKQIDFLHLWT